MIINKYINIQILCKTSTTQSFFCRIIEFLRLFSLWCQDSLITHFWRYAYNQIHLFWKRWASCHWPMCIHHVNSPVYFVWCFTLDTILMQHGQGSSSCCSSYRSSLISSDQPWLWSAVWEYIIGCFILAELALQKDHITLRPPPALSESIVGDDANTHTHIHTRIYTLKTSTDG